jgi:carbon storage regulator
MLVLTRRVGEEIIIGDDIRVTVLGTHNNSVRIGITAPPLVRVDRLEVHERRALHSEKERGHRFARTLAGT